MLQSPGQGQATDAPTQAALSRILEGTASEIGEGFFRALVENLAGALGTRGAWVTEFDPERRRLRALAFWLGGQWVEGWEAAVDGTPCQVVVETRRLVHYPDRVVDLYPHDPSLRGANAVSYMGVPLVDLDGSVLGHLAVLDVQPMPDDPIRRSMFEIFAGRAAAELRRLRVERQVRSRQAQLAALIDSAMDAIVELDGELRVTGMNPAAERTFEVPGEHARGMPLAGLVSPGDAPKLEALLRELQGRPAHARSAWVPGGFTGLKVGGGTFRAEGTLSLFELDRRQHLTLILRNVDEQLEAERRIAALTTEAEYLKSELRDLGRSGEIIGNSPALLHALAEVSQVAPADSTVLILGETGTGKELFARAIHEGSRRRGKALVKVNCAAIPATLIESEFFGHERGAFTGATARRDGRFTLADGGTIFLDEVAELPLELQAKLLRVLQEGEFEPVGSSRTRKVDVRVVAATNRDLRRAVADGKFREDLYYRLSVFPLTLPPLRERGNDVLLLAESFVRQFAGRTGQRLAPIGPDAASTLRGYGWPGNVRELQNVVERAVITARDGKLNLEGALPSTLTGNSSAPLPVDTPGVLTARDLARLERENLRRALEATHWQIAGEGGAAKLLGLAPSTLASRVKALRLRRHR
ncbi:MAG TPA: sigma 54-interacting transcriptional regulator [Myxococcaceae bacterium]|nr:sigma 54-interacting transcriptional regulator [Myxococcaceae bacterium]